MSSSQRNGLSPWAGQGQGSKALLLCEAHCEYLLRGREQEAAEASPHSRGRPLCGFSQEEQLPAGPPRRRPRLGSGLSPPHRGPLLCQLSSAPRRAPCSSQSPRGHTRCPLDKNILTSDTLLASTTPVVAESKVGTRSPGTASRAGAGPGRGVRTSATWASALP